MTSSHTFFKMASGKNQRNTSAPPNAALVFKFIVVGNTDVGKSSLLLQFVEQRFNEKHAMTVRFIGEIRCLNRDALRELVLDVCRAP